MKTINTKIIFLLFLLSSCNDPGKQAKIEEEATKDARMADPDIYKEYIKCYGLDYHKKKYCLEKLEDKYISTETRRNNYYKQYFQYEAEKLGFLELLKNNGAVCDGIKVPPLFEHSVEGYVLKYYNNEVYLLSFNYFRNEWTFIK